MKKNVASQVVGAQMITAADGTAFTTAVLVYVTGDGGTQAIGGGGTPAGAATHEGNGFHTYTPTQAETNYDHVAFTFTTASAIPATVQVYTSFPQTIDNPSVASIQAGLATYSATATILERLPTALVSGRMSADAVAISGSTAAADAVEANIANLDATVSTRATYSAAATILERLPAALVSGRIDASVGAMDANTLTASALATDAVNEIQAAVAAGAVATISGGIASRVAVVSNIKRNQALATFEFVMRATGSHDPTTGLSPVCLRSIDGAAFDPGTLANVAEVGFGVYSVDFGAGDLNGTMVTMLATASGCDSTFERIITVP